MKTYEEMAAAVFARRDAWMERRKRRRKTALRAGGLSVLSATLIGGAIALPALIRDELSGSDPGEGRFHGAFSPSQGQTTSESGMQDDDPGNYAPSFPPRTVLRGYEEYRRYVEEQGLPEDILPYERIAAIGELTELYIPEDRYNHRYIYRLTDEADQTVCLDVYYILTDYAIEGEPMPEDIVQFADLRSIDDECSRMYRYGNCVYHYQNGRLEEICWQVGYWMFSLTGYLYDYPNVRNTFTAGLLCANTAKETFARLDLTGLPDYPDLLGFEGKESTT